MIQVTEDSLFHYCRGGYEFCLAYLRKYGFLLYPINKGKLGSILFFFPFERMNTILKEFFFLKQGQILKNV